MVRAWLANERLQLDKDRQWLQVTAGATATSRSSLAASIEDAAREE
jgi:hypothetical protein